MKTIPTNLFKPSRLCALAAFALNLTTFSPAQETAELIPVPPPSNQPAPQPAKTLEITPDEIIPSRTIVRPDQTITIQEVVPQDLELPPPPPPPKTPSPEQLSARAARLAQRGHFRSSALSWRHPPQRRRHRAQPYQMDFPRKNSRSILRSMV